MADWSPALSKPTRKEQTPDEQTSLTEMEKGRKNATVLDAAIEDVHRCLQNRTFDSFPVTPVAKKSSLRHPYNDESKVEELTNASLIPIHNDPVLSALAEEHQFLAKHSMQHTFTQGVHQMH